LTTLTKRKTEDRIDDFRQQTYRVKVRLKENIQWHEGYGIYGL